MNTFDQQLFSEEIKLLAVGDLPPNWRWVKSSINAKVAYNYQASVYYKEFLPRDRWESIKAALRGSRCKRAVAMASTLASFDFNTPKVICSGKIDFQRDYLITEAVNAAGVASYFASYLRASRSAKTIAWKRKVIEHLGCEIGRLHQEGFIHGDLRPNNVLIEYGNSTPTFHFIDNERTRFWRGTLPEKLVRKNLIQIGMLFPVDISRTDRLRFYQAYQKQYSRFGELDNTFSFVESVYKATINRLNTTAHYKPLQPDLDATAMEQGLIVPPEF